MEISYEWRGDFDNDELNACGFTPSNAGLMKLA
jgi:hypothetical protein